MAVQKRYVKATTPNPVVASELDKPGDEAREVVLNRRRQPLARMSALREKAIANGLELWNEDRFHEEMAVRRGAYASSD